MNQRWNQIARVGCLLGLAFTLWNATRLVTGGPKPATIDDLSFMEDLLERRGKGELAGEQALPEEYQALATASMFGAKPPEPGPAAVPDPVLQGIGTDFAFIRTSEGVRMLRAGEEADGVKVLAIAMNRVLVEHHGEQKELTIYSGFGSGTLLHADEEEGQ